MDRVDGFYTHNFVKFWLDRVRDVGEFPLLITGIGFDPRSLFAANILKKNGIHPKIIPVDFSVQSTGGADVELDDAKAANMLLLRSFIPITDPLEIEMFDEQNRPIGGRLISNNIFNHRELFKDVRDVIIDIGGLPRSLFAPLLSYLVKEQGLFQYKNLHVASLPNERLDNGIKSEEILDPNYMFGYKRPVSEDKIVWIPIIGK